MKIEVTEKTERPMLAREEVHAVASYEGATPNRTDIKKQVSKAAGSKEELTIVKSFKTRFGTTTADIVAFVYKDEAKMKEVEADYMIKRNDPKAKKVEEAAPVAAATEAPQEEKVEEAAEVPAEEAKKEPTEEKAEETPADEVKEEAPAVEEKSE